MIPIFRTILKNTRHKGILFLGKAGDGKSPLMSIIPMAVSRYFLWKDQVKAKRAAFRPTSGLEFCKQEPGTKCTPPCSTTGI